MQTHEIIRDHLSRVQNASLVDCFKGGLYFKTSKPHPKCQEGTMASQGFLLGGVTHTRTHTTCDFFGGQSFQLIPAKVSPDSNDGYSDHQDDTRGWLYRVVPSG